MEVGQIVEKQLGGEGEVVAGEKIKAEMSAALFAQILAPLTPSIATSYSPLIINFVGEISSGFNGIRDGYWCRFLARNRDSQQADSHQSS